MVYSRYIMEMSNICRLIRLIEGSVFAYFFISDLMNIHNELFFVCSSSRSFTSWLKTSSSPIWAWRCLLSRITSSTLSSSSGLLYPFEANYKQTFMFWSRLLKRYIFPTTPAATAAELGHCGGFVCLSHPKKNKKQKKTITS